MSSPRAGASLWWGRWIGSVTVLFLIWILVRGAVMLSVQAMPAGELYDLRPSGAAFWIISAVWFAVMCLLAMGMAGFQYLRKPVLAKVGMTVMAMTFFIVTVVMHAQQIPAATFHEGRLILAWPMSLKLLELREGGLQSVTVEDHGGHWRMVIELRDVGRVRSVPVYRGDRASMFQMRMLEKRLQEILQDQRPTRFEERGLGR